AEDGIRDRNVTGVQTCALPIYTSLSPVLLAIRLESDCCEAWRAEAGIADTPERRRFCVDALTAAAVQLARWRTLVPGAPFEELRSEERRVGEEGGGRGRQACGV